MHFRRITLSNLKDHYNSPPMEQKSPEPVIHQSCSTQTKEQDPWNPWNPIGLLGSLDTTYIDPQCPSSDGRTTTRRRRSDVSHQGSVRSADPLDQSPSSQSRHGATGSSTTSLRDRQDVPSTTPTTPNGSSFPDDIYQAPKTYDIESCSSRSDDREDSSVEGAESVGGRWTILEGLTQGHNRPALGQGSIHPRNLEGIAGRLHGSRRPHIPDQGFALRADPVPIHTEFNRDIQIADVDCKYILASALLDTQCQDGNWISLRLVQRLRMQDRISLEFDSPALTDASGRAIVACGIISLQWKWSPIGTRVLECNFFVFPGSRHLDVIFGVHYILDEELITVNEGAMTPMTAHNKATPAERAAIALALERQKRDKAAREARRIQQQQAERQQGPQSNQSQQNGSHSQPPNQGQQRS